MKLLKKMKKILEQAKEILNILTNISGNILCLLLNLEAIKSILENLV